ncbi:MAG: hypothetical protein ABW124_22675 [Candidatus Thiodiazotropha sp. 6PLUC9]
MPALHINQRAIVFRKRAGEVWTARQQKWRYEEAKGDLETFALLFG